MHTLRTRTNDLALIDKQNKHRDSGAWKREYSTKDDVLRRVWKDFYVFLLVKTNLLSCKLFVEKMFCVMKTIVSKPNY